VTQDELWSRARSTPAGRALLANGASASGLGGAEEGLGWLDGYRDFLSEPSAIPPAGDVAVPTGGGLGLAAAGERTVTVRLSRPARAVVSLRPVGSARSRVIARLRGPLYPRSITLPVDVAPGRYRVRATARGDGLTDSVDIPFRVRAPRVQSVADPRVQQAGGAPSAARTTRPARRADLLRSLIILDARYRVLLRQAAACARRPLRAEIALRRRAVAGATLASPATLGRRLSLLAAGARRLERVSRPCGPPLVPPASPPPAAPPSAPPSPPVAGAPSLTPITIGHIVAGTPLDLSAPLGERVLPSQVIPVELAALNGPACRAAGAVCLGFDRTLLELALNELVNQNLLDLTVRNLLSLNLDGLIAQVASLGAGGDLGESIAVERIDDRSLRLVPLGPLAALVDLPKISDTVVGQVQAVPEIATGVAAVPPGTPQPGPYRPGAAPGERALLRAINRARAQRRLPGLKASRVLARPARLHSANLVRLGYLTHDSNGSPFWTRLVASGFSARRHMGENLAQISGCSPSGAEQAVKVWLGSPVHRANLFSRKFRVLGAGATSDRGCARTVYNADFGG
jgi:uncharacterized protein YkwD